jgi:hypothetical protein
MLFEVSVSTIPGQLLLNKVFGDCVVLFNRIHNGFTAPGEFTTGAQPVFSGDDNTLFPVLLGPVGPSYLVSSIQSRSHTISYVPHGGGYFFPGFQEASVDCLGPGGSIRLSLKLLDGSLMVCPNVTNLPYGFHDDIALCAGEGQGVCKRRVRLDPIYCLCL